MRQTEYTVRPCAALRWFAANRGDALARALPRLFLSLLKFAVHGVREICGDTMTAMFCPANLGLGNAEVEEANFMKCATQDCCGLLKGKAIYCPLAHHAVHAILNK